MSGGGGGGGGGGGAGGMVSAHDQDDNEYSDKAICTSIINHNHAGNDAEDDVDVALVR